jgi:predicted amidophosphoribosyltransferase
MLFEPCCTACARPGAAICVRCVDALVPAPEIDPPPGVDRVAALVRYEGVARDLVLALKYGNRRHGLPELARALAATVADRDLDVVTWVPTTAARRRERGYDQAELLARPVARNLRVRVRPLLRRAPGPPQTVLGRSERLVGPPLRARRRCPRSVLLVVDVCTTGSTLRAAAQALRGAGAEEIHAVVLAVTPFSRTEVHSSHRQ